MQGRELQAVDRHQDQIVENAYRPTCAKRPSTKETRKEREPGVERGTSFCVLVNSPGMRSLRGPMQLTLCLQQRAPHPAVNGRKNNRHPCTFASNRTLEKHIQTSRNCILPFVATILEITWRCKRGLHLWRPRRTFDVAQLGV